MNDLNIVTLVGRITKDIALEYNNNNTPYCQFAIACSEWIPGRNGQDGEEKTSFINLVLWGKSAENLASRACKGTMVSVLGKLRQERWESDGVSYSRLAVKVTAINCLAGYKTQDSRQRQYDSSPPAQQRSQSRPSQPSQRQPSQPSRNNSNHRQQSRQNQGSSAAAGRYGYGPEYDDDIPF